ncbi:MAG: nucleotidyltransferase family protein [Pseudomonadota bacterium]|nr:nucleotidyltransferase family protein [Pseudomonadota bacterium]
MSEADFLALVRRNAANAALLERLPALALPDAYLAAGCLFQAVWNQRGGRAPDWGVRDYDVFYFDPGDLSADAEARIEARVRQITADLGVTVEVKNQARVHTWYRDWFGADYPPLRCTREGIERFLVACTCVGIRLGDGALHAPGGLDDLWRGVLRINPRHAMPALFSAKALSYQRRWPWLTVVEPAAVA